MDMRNEERCAFILIGILLIALSFLLGIRIGYMEGEVKGARRERMTIETEIVTRGYGTWIVTKDRQMEFKWGKEVDKQ